jgi:alanine-synthesizing transaminase
VRGTSVTRPAYLIQEPAVKTIQKSLKLADVCYDIRGPVLEKARQMEEEGHKIIKLNIGNLAPFGFDAPEEIVQDMIRNMGNAAGYTDSKGLFAPRDRDEHEWFAQQRRRGAGASARLPALDGSGQSLRR